MIRREKRIPAEAKVRRTPASELDSREPGNDRLMRICRKSTLCCRKITLTLKPRLR